MIWYLKYWPREIKYLDDAGYLENFPSCLPLSDNYSARGRPGRNAERGILPDLLSAILLCQAYKRNFTTRVMEGLLLNRFLHLHCERASGVSITSASVWVWVVQPGRRGGNLS